MHPEIEKLIKLAIADGEITEKERAVIMRKASTLGEDIDEVEMILDGELALLKNEQKVEQVKKSPSSKAGDLKKCPSCGAPTNSFTSKCPECGHEFRNIDATSSIVQLNKILQEIETVGRARKKRGFFDTEINREMGIANQLATAISSFPVPNTKEDIIEFLANAVSYANVNIGYTLPWNRSLDKNYLLKTAWKSKCEQVIIKGRFSMKDDKKTLEEIEVYAKQLGFK